jgi:hypothetical protein
MQELTKEEVRGLGHAVGLEIQDPELTEVTYSLNALLEDLDHINPPGLETVEPLPILLPPRKDTGLVARRDRCATVPPSRHPVGGP